MKSNAILLPLGEVAWFPNAGQHVYWVNCIYADVFDARAHAFIVLRRGCIEIGRECASNTLTLCQKWFTLRGSSNRCMWLRCKHEQRELFTSPRIVASGAAARVSVV
jgi:hypothetical protein